MRNDASSFSYIPSLIGTMSVIGGTAVGAPVDRIGFGECLALLSAGGIQGSTGSTVTLTVKVQESDNPVAVGTAWSDITSLASVGGSFKFDTITFGGNLAGGDTTGTWQPYRTETKYAYLTDSNRLRYLRVHATLSGTVGLGPKISAGFLLGKPNDTLYVRSAVSQGSGNVEVSKLL